MRYFLQTLLYFCFPNSTNIPYVSVTWYSHTDLFRQRRDSPVTGNPLTSFIHSLHEHLQVSTWGYHGQPDVLSPCPYGTYSPEGNQGWLYTEGLKQQSSQRVKGGLQEALKLGKFSLVHMKGRVRDENGKESGTR